MTLAPLDSHYTAFWQQLKTSHLHQRFGQAMLCIGEEASSSAVLFSHIACLLLCKATTPPCYLCGECTRVMEGVHPDLIAIAPDKEHHAIKVESIRNLASVIYQKPKRGQAVVICIDKVHALSEASANALLKMLEEPPSYVYFILHSTKLDDVLPTIRSRCQRFFLPLATGGDERGRLAGQYPADSAEGQLLNQLEPFAELIVQILQNNRPLIALGEAYGKYPPAALIWLLMLIWSSLITHKLTQKPLLSEALMPLALSQTVYQAMTFFDELQAKAKIVRHNVSINSSLLLDACMLMLKDKQ